jgi:two-component system response regulator GlrR
MPALRERAEDIPLLAAHFLQAAAERSGKDAKTFAPQAMELLAAAAWPGNVRQLQNVVEQTFALSPTAVVPPDLVQRALKMEPGPVASLAEQRGEFERDYLVRLLRMTLGNVSSAARMAQRNRTEFYKLLNRHGLRAAEFRNPPAS